LVRRWLHAVTVLRPVLANFGVCWLIDELMGGDRPV